jgi:hypothetical protein
VNRFAKLGATAFKIYTCHLLVFTAGAICGAIEAFIILTAMYGAVPQ